MFFLSAIMFTRCITFKIQKYSCPYQEENAVRLQYNCSTLLLQFQKCNLFCKGGVIHFALYDAKCIIQAVFMSFHSD